MPSPWPDTNRNNSKSVGTVTGKSGATSLPPRIKKESAASRSSSRRPTSPARSTWGMPSTTRCRTCSSAITACSATRGCGCRGPITPASRPRTSSSASCSPRVATATRSAARHSSSGSGSGRTSPAGPSPASSGASACRATGRRERFTMDEGLSRAVREVFVTLYEQGLITRDRYLINWCPRCQTALSDIEVEHEERDGSLWHMRYPLEDGSGVIVVATTRPETMLGDTAVAVHPEDERYKALVGKTRPLAGARARDPGRSPTPTCDEEFGSGAVKITPAHDPNDYEMGLRHSLPDGLGHERRRRRCRRRRASTPGSTREDCRASIVERFERDGTLDRVEPHRPCVGTCYRCHTVVEPLVSTQWFVQVQAAGRRSRRGGRGRAHAVRSAALGEDLPRLDGEHPAWCISRQLWWGHRIPGLVLRRLRQDDRRPRRTPKACPDCGGARSPGRGRARHLVQLGAVAVFDAGLARATPDARALLSRRACW